MKIEVAALEIPLARITEVFFLVLSHCDCMSWTSSVCSYSYLSVTNCNCFTGVPGIFL